LRTALDTRLEAYASLIASDFVSHFPGTIILPRSWTNGADPI